MAEVIGAAASLAPHAVGVSRYRRLRRVMAAGLVLAPALHFGRAAAAPSAPPAARIVYADGEGNPLINPFQSCCVSATTQAALFSPLIRIGTHGGLVPELLAAIPSPANHQIRAGGKEVILRLRPHEYWSSGVEITAQDLWFGWRVGMDPRSGGGRAACTGTCDHIQSITVAGRYEAILHLATVDAEILTRDLPPVLPHAWARLGGSPPTAAIRLPSLNFAHPGYWTDGPFAVKRFTPDGDLVLVPMPYYRLHRLASRAELVDRIFRSSDDMLHAAAAGTLDVIVDGPAPVLFGAPGYVDAYRVGLVPSFDSLAVEFNALDPSYAPLNGAASASAVPNPLHDVRVRQALALAINRPELVMDALRLGTPAADVLTAFTPLLATRGYATAFADTHIRGTWDPLLKRYVPYGVIARRDARILLTQAGYENGLDLDVIVYPPVPGGADIVQRLAASWDAVGVRLHYDPHRYPALPSCYGRDLAHAGSTGHFEVVLTTVHGDLDPSVLAPQVSSASIYRGLGNSPADDSCSPRAGRTNFAGIADPRIDAQLARGEETVDIGARRAAYDAVQARVIQSAYWIPLYYQPNVIVRGRRMRGVTEAPDGVSPVFEWRTNG